MKKKSPPYLVIGAVILGIVAVVGFVKYNNDQAAATAAAIDTAIKKQHADDVAQFGTPTANVTVTPTPTNMRQVLYATQVIQPGEKISPSYFEPKLTPDDVLPDAYVPANAPDVTGMVAIRPIDKGDPITHHNIGTELDHMSHRLHPGMLSISLSVFNADVNDTGGFLTDGDKVDLFFTTLSQDTTLVLKTELLLQNVSVLYVPNTETRTDLTSGLKVMPPPGAPVTVTFEVTPEEAQALIFLSQVKNGRFSMLLKRKGDEDIIKVKPFSGEVYPPDALAKVEPMVEKSLARAKALQAQVDAAAAAAAAANKTPPAPGTTNEPIPPTH